MARTKQAVAKKTAPAKKQTIIAAKQKTQQSVTAKQTEAPKQEKAIARLTIKTDEVAAILGIHLRSAQRLLQDLRESLGKEPKSYISIKEFAKHVQLDYQDIRKQLN
jgi:hypothetical protein